jgi:hypothetical protein
MAGNAYLTANVVVRADGREYGLGTGDLPVTVALTSPGGVDARQFDIANAATATLFDSTVGPVGSFKFCAILSDKTIMLEIQGTTAAANGHVEIFAGVPFILASDNTQAYAAGGNFAGAAQDILKLLAKNSSGAAALVRTIISE